MEPSLIEFVRTQCVYLGTVKYRTDSTGNQFAWTSQGEPAPSRPGVYFVLSHDGTVIQKIGKAEGGRGLSQRMGAYLRKRTLVQIKDDPTDERWWMVMTGPLSGQQLQVYCYVTELKYVTFNLGKQSLEIECQWARGLEKVLSKLARSQGHDKAGMLLSGTGN